MLEFEINKELSYKESDDEQNLLGIKLDNIILTTDEYNDVLCSFLLDDANLNMIFSEKIDDCNIKKSYDFFIPDHLVGEEFTEEELRSFVVKKLKSDPSYYSGVAEGIMPLIMNKINNWKLSRSVYTLFSSLMEITTGADSCYYDDSGIIVLGEAKFYKSFGDGIDSLLYSINERPGHKPNSLFNATRNNQDAMALIKKMNTDLSDDSITLKEFKKLKKIYAGFILHKNQKRYNNHLEKFKREELSVAIEAFGEIDQVKIYHLPVESKTELIIDLIMKAKEMINE